MPYQSFPWQRGESSSVEKLIALYLPDLAGKSVLDVGCNLGFFCGYAAFQGASVVVGVDKNPGFIRRAQILFPQCQFICQDWQNLDARQYDVVLFISALHYAKDQKLMLDFLMQRVKPDGLLVLEIGIAPGEKSCFVEVKRNFFPTRAKVQKMLQDYAYKPIGNSIRQVGEPLPHFVYHICHKRPFAILLMDEHYSGKTTLASQVFSDQLRYIRGDSVLNNIVRANFNPDGANCFAISQEMQTILATAYKDGHFNSAGAVNKICQTGRLQELCALIYQETQGQSFLLDMYIPAEYRQAVCAYFDKYFYVADLAIYAAHIRPYTKRHVDVNKAAKNYLRYLQTMFSDRFHE